MKVLLFARIFVVRNQGEGIMKKHIAIVLLVASFCWEAFAVRIQRPFYTLRSKGQGGAITASADDYSAVVLNPANMAEFEESKLNMGFGGSMSSNFFDFASDFTDVVGEKNQAQQALKLNDLLNNYNGESFALNPMFYGAYSGPSWGLAVMPINTDSVIQVSNTQLDINSYLDGIMIFGMGRKYNEKISWGFNTKAIYRGYFSVTYTQSNFINNDEFFNADDANFGLTVDADLAMNYKFDPWKNIDTKVSVVLRNLLDYGFKYSATNVEPPKLGRKLDIGSEFRFKKLWVFQPKLLFDIRDIGVKDWDFQSGYHIGAELDWQTYDWLKGGYRIGLNQGYFTAGLNMQFAWFRLDLASWGEEVGTKDNRKELRRVALQMSLDF